jgi:hypothetical protein
VPTCAVVAVVDADDDVVVVVVVVVDVVVVVVVAVAHTSVLAVVTLLGLGELVAGAAAATVGPVTCLLTVGLLRDVVVVVVDVVSVVVCEYAPLGAYFCRAF